MHKNAILARALADPTGGAYSAPSDPLAGSMEGCKSAQGSEVELHFVKIWLQASL